MEWLKSISYWLVVSPLLVFFLTVFILRFRYRTGQRAVKYACDAATLFLLAAIPAFSGQLFHRTYGLNFLLVLLLLGVLLTFFYAKKEGEIHYGKLFRLYWRVLFLVLTILYLLLCLFGIGWSIYLYMV